LYVVDSIEHIIDERKFEEYVDREEVQSKVQDNKISDTTLVIEYE